MINQYMYNLNKNKQKMDKSNQTLFLDYKRQHEIWNKNSFYQKQFLKRTQDALQRKQINEKEFHALNLYALKYLTIPDFEILIEKRNSIPLKYFNTINLKEFKKQRKMNKLLIRVGWEDQMEMHCIKINGKTQIIYSFISDRFICYTKYRGRYASEKYYDS